MYCEMCGAANDDNAKKCVKCGFSFVDSAEESKEEFAASAKKFKEENAETIRYKSVTERAATKVSKGADAAGKQVKKMPLPLKIVACLVILAGIAYGINFYIQTNNFFVPETDPATGEIHYLYYRNKNKIINSNLFLRGKNYRVDSNGYRIENQFYEDEKGNAYYYGNEGVMENSGWFHVDGEERYAGKNGVVVRNSWLNDTFYMDENGIKTRDKAVGDYYVDTDGKRVKNAWKNDHYYGKDGLMLKNTRSPDEKQYKLDQNGDIVYDPSVQIFNQNFRKGSTIIFGSFEQDGNEANGPEAIEWYFLSGDQDKAYLISKKVLMTEAYQTSEFANNVDNQWKGSNLQQKLSGYFYPRAFDDIDKKYIKETDLGKVFVPSIAELNEYLPNELHRICAPTEVAKNSLKFSKFISKSAIYWLRDNGVNPNHKAFVSDTGQVIIDDVSKTLESNYKIFDTTVSGFAGSLGDKVGKGILSYVIGQIPIVGDIINSIGLTDDLYNAIIGEMGDGFKVGDNGYVSDSDKKKIEDIVKRKIEVPADNVKKEVINNPYIDVGLITNHNGVRPMVIIDMKANDK